MCFETIISYSCKCKVILTNICYEHIVHTLEQKDNTTCPHFQREQRREKSLPHRCGLRTGAVLEDGTIFFHGSRKPRVEYKFELDPNSTDRSLSGRRGTGRRYEGSSVDSSSMSPTRPQIKQEEPTEPMIKSEHPSQPCPPWLNPSAFYNTEPHCSHLPPAYTPTWSRLLTPYDPDAEMVTFGEGSEVMNENRRSKSMIRDEHGENENQDMDNTNNRKRLKIKREVSFNLGTQSSGAFFRQMEREFEETKNLLWRKHVERKGRRNGDMYGGEGDDVDMK